mmetsp:Transcript_43511/g.87091  ORF Transcript_43511/g.87091 Transcript_43511/m.87091 type:complete len:109 (+) Transcript_43511:97-423(+)
MVLSPSTESLRMWMLKRRASTSENVAEPTSEKDDRCDCDLRISALDARDDTRDCKFLCILSLFTSGSSSTSLRYPTNAANSLFVVIEFNACFSRGSWNVATERLATAA